jgi:hypothetical protein
VTVLRLASEFLPLVREGRKTATIRAGNRRLPVGAAEIVAGSERFPIVVKDVRVTRFGALSEVDADRDGFSDVDGLREALLRFYPTLGEDSEVTVIEFVLRGEQFGDAS